MVERLPDRALGHLAVAAEHPDVVGQLVEALAGQRDADADRAGPGPSEPVATSTQGSTGVGWPSRRLPNLRKRQQLLVGDRARPPCTSSRAAARRGPWRRSGGRCSGPRGRQVVAEVLGRAARPSGRRPTWTRSGGPELAAALARMESTRKLLGQLAPLRMVVRRHGCSWEGWLPSVWVSTAASGVTPARLGIGSGRRPGRIVSHH